MLYTRAFNDEWSLTDGLFVNRQAVWSRDPKSVSQSEHEDFYRFIANAFDQPRYHLHYRADAPLDIKALFYVPNDKPST